METKESLLARTNDYRKIQERQNQNMELKITQNFQTLMLTFEAGNELQAYIRVNPGFPTDFLMN
jgi:hypothetical protein